MIKWKKILRLKRVNNNKINYGYLKIRKLILKKKNLFLGNKSFAMRKTTN